MNNELVERWKNSGVPKRILNENMSGGINSTVSEELKGQVDPDFYDPNYQSQKFARFGHILQGKNRDLFQTILKQNKKAVHEDLKVPKRKESIKEENKVQVSAFEAQSSPELREVEAYFNFGSSPSTVRSRSNTDVDVSIDEGSIMNRLQSDQRSQTLASPLMAKRYSQQKESLGMPSISQHNTMNEQHGQITLETVQLIAEHVAETITLKVMNEFLKEKNPNPFTPVKNKKFNDALNEGQLVKNADGQHYIMQLKEVTVNRPSAAKR